MTRYYKSLFDFSIEDVDRSGIKWLFEGNQDSSKLIVTHRNMDEDVYLFPDWLHHIFQERYEYGHHDGYSEKMREIRSVLGVI